MKNGAAGFFETCFSMEKNGILRLGQNFSLPAAKVPEVFLIYAIDTHAGGEDKR